MFGDVYKDKKVLITGNTGFKGSWITVWLLKLGARVIGISNNVPTKPSMFEELKLSDKIKYYQDDIRDLTRVIGIISTEKPDFIFHMAAQSIVSISYIDPILTMSSNVIGTLNILEALRGLNHKCVAILITSDKAYENVEQVWGYKEDDHMGGRDIYSGSKGAAELVIKSYFYSFFDNNKCNVRIATTRAGNVIGGGDWAKDRIVADCMRAWSKNNTVDIRSPNATRPWQHTLEPLSGYLYLGYDLFKSKKLHGEGFNFGPRAEQNHTVEDLLIDLSKHWNLKNNAYKIIEDKPFHEAGLLKLNCDKALYYLNWQANLNYVDTVRFTSEWYYEFYHNDNNMFEKTIAQIYEYEILAQERNLKWTA
jgi:CDP-glucose 4,6-dehydratase